MAKHDVQWWLKAFRAIEATTTNYEEAGAELITKEIFGMPRSETIRNRERVKTLALALEAWDQLDTAA